MAETASLNLNPRAVIGANMPPLLEQLTEETKLLVQRADDLIGGASRAVVTDRDSAERATLLAGMLRDHIKLIDKAREERKLPFLRDGRIVDAHFGAIESRLATYDPKGKVIGGPLHTVVSMEDRYRRDEEAKAASERARLEEAARVERAKAAAALRAQQEAEERERRAAEDAARKSAPALADPKAPWRGKPATDRQLSTLRKMRISYWDGISAGEASGLISARIARKMVGAR